jgi:hypothetical protein
MIVGYHIEIAAGHDPSIYDGAGVLGTTLQEGWVQIMAPLGSGLDVRVGRMATLAGYEVLESVNNMNYSRGMLFGLIQPFTHTGLRMSYQLGEMVGATIGVNNGPNFGNTGSSGLFADNDHGKMLEMQVALKPIKDLSANFTLLFGNDTFALSNTAGDNFWLFDIVVAYQMDKLTLALNADFFSAQDARTGLVGELRRAPLSGLALYAKYQLTDAFAQALRFEYFSDKEGGFIAGLGPNALSTNDSGTGSRVFGITLTSELKVAQQLILRFELRHDNSNNHNFTRGNENAQPFRPARGDTTIGFEAIMPF